MSEGVRKETAWKPATGGIEFKSGSWLNHKTALKIKCGLYFYGKPKPSTEANADQVRFLFFPVGWRKENKECKKFQTTGNHCKTVPPFYRGSEPAAVVAWSQCSKCRSAVSDHCNGSCKRSLHIKSEERSKKCS